MNLETIAYTFCVKEYQIETERDLAMTTACIIIAVLLILLLIISAYILSYLSRKTPLPLPKKLIQMIEGGLAGNAEMPDSYRQRQKEREQWLESQHMEQIHLKNARGYRLRAQYLPTKLQRKGMVLACHGARSSGIGEFSFISQFLNEQGYDLFLVDHRSCGESEGSYMGYGLYESKDTMLWLEYINNRFGTGLPLFLYGVSMGGATVLMMSKLALPANVKGIVADCSYTSAWNEFRYQLKTSFHLPPFPFLYLVDFMSVVMAGYSFRKASPLEAVKHSKVPILFFHGAKDDYVPCFMVHDLYEACTSKKDLLIIPDAVHAKSYQTHPERYGPKMLHFFDSLL